MGDPALLPGVRRARNVRRNPSWRRASCPHPAKRIGTRPALLSADRVLSLPHPPPRVFRQVVAVGAITLAAAAMVLLVGSQRDPRRGLEQELPAPSKGAGGPAGGSAGAPGAAGTPSTADATEREISNIGREALKMWGAWDGLSPVATQMMAQVPPSRAPAAEPAPAREQGERGRIRQRLQNAERDGLHVGAASASQLAAAMPQGDPVRAQSLSADESLDHLEREAAPFPYVAVSLSLHGVRQELGTEQLTQFKKAIAEAVDLQKYGSASMEAVLGGQSWEWIVVQNQRPLNCSAAPHICDDKGRRRRLLSVEEEEPRQARARPPRPGRRGTWARQKEEAQQEERLAGEMVDAEKLRAAKVRVLHIEHELHDAEGDEGRMKVVRSEGQQLLLSEFRRVPVPAQGYRINSAGQKVFFHDYIRIDPVAGAGAGGGGGGAAGGGPGGGGGGPGGGRRRSQRKSSAGFAQRCTLLFVCCLYVV